jgi:hypothetical protein
VEKFGEAVRAGIEKRNMESMEQQAVEENGSTEPEPGAEIVEDTEEKTDKEPTEEIEEKKKKSMENTSDDEGEN